MALSKIIELDNGVSMSYHRISSITIATNIQNVITVISYPSSEKRSEELDWLTNQKLRIELMNKLDSGDSLTKEESDIVRTEQDPMNVYTVSRVFVIPYDEYMTVESAYEYLKTLSEFAGATDI